MNLLIFLLAALGRIKFSFVGEIVASEVLMAALLPWQLGRMEAIIKLPEVRRVLLAGGAYLAAQIASDMYRGTLPSDFLRGWAKIIMMVFAFLSIASLIGGSRRRLFNYILGLIVAPLLEIATQGVQYPLYKFYLGPVVSIASFLIAAAAPSIFSGGLAPIAAIVAAFGANARSLAGMTAVATCYALVFRRSGQRVTSLGDANRRIWIAGFALAAVAWGSLLLYDYAAPRGLFGLEAQEKHAAQSDASGKFDVFRSRDELNYSWPKISESPIIGWGSWVKDYEYVSRISAVIGSTYIPEDGLIPAHSHIFGSWLEAGFVGAIFWVFVAGRTIRMVVTNGAAVYGRCGLAVCFLAIALLWDVLFSPFAGERRLHSGFMLWIITYPLFVERRQREAGTAVKARPLADMLPVPSGDMPGMS